jgi:heat shock protein HslJ
MKLINTLTVITWVLVMLVACGGTSRDPLNGTAWQLYSIGQYSPIPGSKITLRFENGQASGNAGCNSYGGNYQVNGDQVRFEQLVSTLMACADQSVMDQESAYLKFLGEAQRFEVSEGQLQIYRSDGEALTFVRAQ